MREPVIHPPDPRENLICRCYRVTEDTIRRAIEEHGLRTVEEVKARTNASGGCSSCYDDVQDILDQMHGTPTKRLRVSPLTNAQKRTLIQKIVRDLVAPLARLNDLEMHLIGVDGDRLFARYRGPAVGTTLPSFLTLKWFLVQITSQACGQKMQLIEMNVLESPATPSPVREERP